MRKTPLMYDHTPRQPITQYPLCRHCQHTKEDHWIGYCKGLDPLAYCPCKTYEPVETVKP